MNYLQQSFSFKIRKAVRYTFMYGPSRTHVKIRSQYHMSRRFANLPETRMKLGHRQTVAVIGCGNYAFSNIAYYLKKRFGAVIGACMDIDIHRSASLATYYSAPFFTTNIDDLLELEPISLFYIASNHASHAEYAIAALERRKHVYIEKPHIVSEDQLKRLVGAMRRNPNQRVWLGFNRPNSRFGRLMKKHLDDQEGPAVYNWFVAGHKIDPDHWYFRPEEGGRVLGNLCHWTDAALRQAGEQNYPIVVRTMRAYDTDAVTLTFGDGTIAVISFSAKGSTFEGVKEHCSAQRGNCLASMDDYRTLNVEVAERKYHYRNWFRDHGHEKNITRAYIELSGGLPFDSQAQRAYVWNTGMLFLKIRQALETNREVLVEPYDEMRDFPLDQLQGDEEETSFPLVSKQA